MRIAFGILILALVDLLSVAAGEGALPSENLLERLVGTWHGTGRVTGKDVEADICVTMTPVVPAGSNAYFIG